MPDGELVYRRAAGEPLRALASDYDVAHTTLGRYFARPQVARQLREQVTVVRAEQRAARSERAAGQRLEREPHKSAREQAALERAQARRAAAARAELARRRPIAGSAYADWLDERDTARPATRAELHSRSDEIAAAVVAAGEGIEQVVEATDLRTRENVLRSIDPAILVRAFANDDAARAAARAAAPPDRSRLRRLLPDSELLRRRAAGEPLRPLAQDYGVAHTSLGRYFARPPVAGQLRALARQRPEPGTGQPPGSKPPPRPTRAAPARSGALRGHERGLTGEVVRIGCWRSEAA